MDAQTSGNQQPPKSGQPNQKRNAKILKAHGIFGPCVPGKSTAGTASIFYVNPTNSTNSSAVPPGVFTKGMSIQTIPSLSKQLKGVTDCIIGLQYVWEYRSPSKSVPPHYHCKLCAVSHLQQDMLAHVKGWKHCLKYLQKAYPDKIAHDKAEAIKDPAIRKSIKEAGAEVEKLEGRGQLKVILKEPFEVPAFKGLRSATPKAKPPPLQGMGLRGPPFGPRFSEMGFLGEFPSSGGPLSDYEHGDYREAHFGGYPPHQDFLDSGINQRPYSDDVGNFPGGDGFGPGGDDFRPSCGRDGFGRSSLLDESPSRMHPDDYQGSHMGRNQLNRPMDKALERPGLMGAAPESSNQPNALLTYLDTFRIENESDAQLVLKVTQKLTDVLMEYRLRSISKGPSLNNLPMSSNFSSAPSRLSSNIDRFSSSPPGPSRYYK